MDSESIPNVFHFVPSFPCDYDKDRISRGVHSRASPRSRLSGWSPPLAWSILNSKVVEDLSNAMKSKPTLLIRKSTN